VIVDENMSDAVRVIHEEALPGEEAAPDDVLLEGALRKAAEAVGAHGSREPERG
jgi:hypothetical protein